MRRPVVARTSLFNVACLLNCTIRQCSPLRTWSHYNVLQTSMRRSVVAGTSLFHVSFLLNCTARQCSPLRRKFMEYSIINPTLSLSMKHLVIDQRQNAPILSAFHWSPHGSLVSIGQHFVTTLVVHLPKRTDTNLITESDLITETDQIVRAVHSCNSWLLTIK